VRQFPKGHSNLTYLLTFDNREVVLRRPPLGAAIATAHDMGREYAVLRGLAAHWPKAPRALAHCADPAVIGAPFYLMERRRGLILRGPTLPPGLHLPRDGGRRLSERFVDTLVELHALDPSWLGLDGFGRPAGYVARQVKGWTERFERAKTDPVPEFDQAARWLAAHQPREAGAALIHNDFKYDNLVLDPNDPTRVGAVLDWEMATIADPLMDLGTSLAYWIDPNDPDEAQLIAQGPTLLPGTLSRREVVHRYELATGRDVSQIVFYYVYGLVKVAVIAQQIYKRFQEGHTKDPRFAGLLFAVQVVSRAACRAAERGRIHDLA
jgi:aminoglycoside phosphotransferase (APT) family kinase protein